MNERKPLDFSLDEFSPRPAKSSETPVVVEQKRVDAAAAFPSRETGQESQMNIKTTEAIINRFRLMAKSDRYRHGEFLSILMDAYEDK